MNPAIGAFVGVSKQTEMLLMTVLALWVNIFDMAIFEISSNLDQVWTVQIDKEIFNPNAEYVIRMLLSGVVLVRTFTLHLYIAFLIAVFWPVCFGTRPTLMLPWLVVSAVKNLGTGIVSVGTGGYTCMIYGPLRPACLRFLLSQLIDLSPSFYMWFVGLSLYCDLKKPKSVNRLQVKAMEDQELNMALRRRKVKSMIDEDILRQQFESRSFQKKFLGTSAVEVNEFINHCSYDIMKNKFSRSLDSLLDVLTVQTELLDIEDSEPLDIDSSSTLQQKTAKLLGISMHEIDCIKQNRQTRKDFPAYPIQPQKKIQAISLINSKYDSPAKLLPETSLYSPPNIKPIRVTKSELKSARDFLKVESEFMQTVLEKEINVYDFTQDESFVSFTNMQTLYESNNSSSEPDVDATVDLENTNLSKKNSSSNKEQSKNWDTYSQIQERGKLEDVQVEIPTIYKFFNTMTDKSHYLLDEHCFLFDKESMIMKNESSKVVSVYAKRKRFIDQNPSEEKQRRLNAPRIDINTRFKDNVLNKTTLVDKPENKNSKSTLKKSKEAAINKKISKLVEKTQAIKKKIVTKKDPSNNYSNIPVLNRNTKNQKGYFSLKKNIASQSNLFTIEKTTEENTSINTNLSVKERNKLFSNGNQTEQDNTKNILLNEEKQNTPSISNQEKTKSNQINLLNTEKLSPADDFKISVIAEVERINQKSSSLKKKSFKAVDNIKNTPETEMINKKNYLHSMQFGTPAPFIFIKHSPVIMSSPLKDEINTHESPIAKEENKSFINNIRLKKSEALSEKLIQILKEKTKSKADKIRTEDNNITGEFKTVDNKQFEFSAKIKNNEINFPNKSLSRNKKLEFHFKEKITKTKDNKMEDLFKKKSVTERKETKTSDKEKLGFPSYFSNKINRMITDACQIRKKSCKKINLFIKVPRTNTSSRQRSKLSTVELFRKQSPQKTNLFDVTRKLPIGIMEIPPFKGYKCEEGTTDLNKNKRISSTTVSNMREATIEKLPEDSYITHIPNSISTLKSLSKISEYNDDKTIVTTNEAQSISNVKCFLCEDMHNTNSPINSFMSFKPSEIFEEEYSFTSNTNENVIKIEDPISVSKTELQNADTKEKQFRITLVKSDIFKDCEKETESPCKVNLFDQKLNTITAQENDNSSTSESKSCDKLAEQAMYTITAPNKSKSNDIIAKNVNCKKLSEQAISKIISLANTGYENILNREFKVYATGAKLNTPGIVNCKKLSDYAINKLLSMTTMNNIIKTNMTDNKPKTNTENINEIPNIKNILDTKQTKVSNIVTKIETFNNSIGDRANKNTLHTYDVSSKAEDFNKILKKNGPELISELFIENKEIEIGAIRTTPITELNSQSNTPKEFKSKVYRKNSIPVVKEDIVIQKLPKILPSIITNQNKTKEKCIDFVSDLKENKRNIISLIEGEINTKPVCKSIKDRQELDFNATDLTNSGFLNTEATLKPAENKNIPITIIVKTKNCEQHSQLDSSEIELSSYSPFDETMLTAEKQPNTINTHSKETLPTVEENENILNIKDEDNNNTTSFKNESIKTPNISLKEENPNNPANKEDEPNNPATKEEKDCKGTSQHCIQHITSTKSEYSQTLNLPLNEEIFPFNRLEEICESLTKNECPTNSNFHYEETMLTAEDIQTASTNKEENACNEVPQHGGHLISSNISEALISKNEYNVFVTKKGEINNKITPTTIFSNNTNAKTNDSAAKEEKKFNDILLSSNIDYKANIPLIKLEKECRGTSQHCIKLISSTGINYAKKLNNSKEPIKEKDLFTKILKPEEKDGLQNDNKMMSFLLYETVYNSSLPLKEEKICKGTSQHNIKLISSNIHKTTSETYLGLNEKTPYKVKDDLLIPHKEQKVCKGSSQNFIKLISSSKEYANNNTNLSHKEALSNILKEYQSVPIMKEEKVCRGASNHKIKLISSYKKDSPNKINLFHTETDLKNNKNDNITIIKEEKICEGTLHHSIKLISSSKPNSPNKTIFIVKEQLPKEKKSTHLVKEDCKEDVQKSSFTNKPSIQTNLFVNVNTANGRKNFTVIQEQKDDKVSIRSSTKPKLNLFAQDQMTSTETSKEINKKENMDAAQKINLFSNTMKDFLENDTKKIIKPSLNKKDTISECLKKENNTLVDIKSSDILSSLIQKVETSIKQQKSNEENVYDKYQDETNELKCCKYNSNQVDFGCQTSTLSKKILDGNPSEMTKTLSRSKSITRSSTKSYQDLNLQKLAFAMTNIKTSNTRVEAKPNYKIAQKEEKKETGIILDARASRNTSYVSIHKERLEKAKSLESDLNKMGILQNCAFLEDGYTRLYNLLGVKQENFNTKARKKDESSFFFDN